MRRVRDVWHGTRLRCVLRVCVCVCVCTCVCVCVASLERLQHVSKLDEQSNRILSIVKEYPPPPPLLLLVLVEFVLFTPGEAAL